MDGRPLRRRPLGEPSYAAPRAFGEGLGKLASDTMTSADLQPLADMLQLMAEPLVPQEGGRALTQPQKVEEVRRLGGASELLDSWGVPRDAEYMKQIKYWEASGVGMTFLLNADYPTLLREVREAPGLLFYEGNLDPADHGVSVVGSRNAGQKALTAAGDIARSLAAHRITVISGLAEGIDTAAHTAALDVHARTVAVMGTGLQHTYPAQNRPLREQIVASGGLIISQFTPEKRGSRSSFPMRNSVMSGYGLATVVVAAQEKSGTRHQALAAVKHGRGLIFTSNVAASVSWARAYVSQGLAKVANSAEEAGDIAAEMLADRNRELALF